MWVSRQSICTNVFDYISIRQELGVARLVDGVREHHLAHHLPNAMIEKELSFGQVDKIFAAQWLDEYNIICGTKCNKLLVQNIETRKAWNIPLLAGSKTGVNNNESEKDCGIHCIAINENSTKLATGAQSANSIGFYELPSLQPICVGDFHTNWLFCSAWISDDVLVSGSRDKRLAFWQVTPEKSFDIFLPFLPRIKPVQTIEKYENIDRVRAMVYNPLSQNLATVVSNGFVHLWDVNNCAQITSTALPFLKENVCIAYDPNNHLYAVGSVSHVALLDSQSGKTIGSVCSSDQGAGVRSISFQDSVITIGTGYGSLLFYDVRMNKMLKRPDESVCQQKTGSGWLRKDSVYQQYFSDTDCYPNAIYAHSYHPNSMKLLTAGGPLALGLYGNYAAYWD